VNAAQAEEHHTYVEQKTRKDSAA